MTEKCLICGSAMKRRSKTVSDYATTESYHCKKCDKSFIVLIAHKSVKDLVK